MKLFLTMLSSLTFMLLLEKRFAAQVLSNGTLPAGRLTVTFPPLVQKN